MVTDDDRHLKLTTEKGVVRRSIESGKSLFHPIIICEGDDHHEIASSHHRDDVFHRWRPHRPQRCKSNSIVGTLFQFHSVQSTEGNVAPHHPIRSRRQLSLSHQMCRRIHGWTAGRSTISGHSIPIPTGDDVTIRRTDTVKCFEAILCTLPAFGQVQSFKLTKSFNLAWQEESDVMRRMMVACDLVDPTDISTAACQAIDMRGVKGLVEQSKDRESVVKQVRYCIVIP